MSDSRGIESETITNVPVPTSQETVALSISTTPISVVQCERKNFHHRRPTMHLISESIGLSIHNRFANNNHWYSVVDSLRNSDENRMDRNFYDIDAMDRNNLYRYDYDHNHNHNNYDDDDDDEKKRIRQKSSRNYCNDYDEVDADDWGGEEDLPYGGDGNPTASTKAEQLRRSEFDDFRSVANNFESENLQPNCSKQNLQPSSELSTNVFPKQSTNRDRCELRSISFASPSTMLTVTKPSQSSVMVTSMKSSSTMAQSTMMIHQRSYDGRKTIATRQNESNNNSASVVSKSSAELFWIVPILSPIIITNIIII
ncbi:hypothetical protein SSS_08977 [Sarcoptes scabiei]|uniref:Uncharacterized protein n=1 Tax=Sarcoptes scabiei TaxID=52283 RepID=A0A834VF58_SARSC|nr:hypothetical protein SSS_08977 [Sarcoptes scabiei]